MKYKFEKSKYPIFKVAFWILIFCSIFSFIMIAKNNAYSLSIKGFSPILKPITTNIEFSRYVNDKIFICFDDYCKPLEENSMISQRAGFSFINSVSFNEEDKTFSKPKIKNVYLALPKNMKNADNKIEKVSIYFADKGRYYDFTDIKSFENKEVSLMIDGEKKPQKYTIYKFKNSNNYIGIKKHLLTILLSFTTKIKLYTLPYCWLFVALLIFLFNKDAFKASLKAKGAILSSVVLFISLFAFIFSFLLPKEIDTFGEYILNDIEHYSKTHKIHIIAENKKLSKKLKNIDAIWHYINSKDKKINKIEKEKFVKNNQKTIIYFDSNSADIDSLSMFNAKAKIYYTNYGAIGKLIYN